MIEIEILETLVPPELLTLASQGTVDSILEGVAQAARGFWVKLASNDNLLGSHWRYDYLNGIQEVQISPGRVVISLVGETPHMLENGFPRTDMRDILLNDNTTPVVPMGERGIHRSADGNLFRSIPFRHTTPGGQGTPGKTVGQVMGSPYHNVVEDSRKLGWDVYKAAKQLVGTQSTPGRGSVYGGRLKAGTGGATSMANLATGRAHKTDIYSGMIREEKTYEKATQSQYKTFRTISTGVQDGSWIRQRIPARHYAEDVSAFAGRLIPKAFAALGED